MNVSSKGNVNWHPKVGLETQINGVYIQPSFEVNLGDDNRTRVGVDAGIKF